MLVKRPKGRSLDHRLAIDTLVYFQARFYIVPDTGEARKHLKLARSIALKVVERYERGRRVSNRNA